jgi:hypothetical protein
VLYDSYKALLGNIQITVNTIDLHMLDMPAHELDDLEES